MREMKRICSIILLQHLLHFRWFVNRIYPNLFISKVFIKMLIINLPIFIFILSFIVFFVVFNFITSNDINISLIIGERIFIFYYLLLLIYFVRNSFDEAYTRAFHSKDYYYLRLQNVSPFTLQVAKMIDAYFLEIVLYVFPIHLGLTLSFIISFNIVALWGWITVFLLVVMLSLSIRGLFMVILFWVDNHNILKRKGYVDIFGIIFMFFVGWFASFSLVQYITNTDFIFTIMNKIINTFRLGGNPFKKIWFIGGTITIIIFVSNFTYLYFFQKIIDKYRIGLRVKEKRKIGKLEQGLFSQKSTAKFIPIFTKDLILLFRGEYISIGFIKANFVFFSFFLGVISALSFELYESKYIGVICLMIIVYQMVSNELITQSISKISSIDQERDWLKFYYPHMNNPYFVYISKFILQFSISFGTLLISTIVILLFIKVSFNIILLLLLSSFCVTLISSLSFLVGNACFPNFRWETQDQINTSIPGYITENIFIRIYQVIIISFLGAYVAFLYAEKITISNFILNSLITFSISTLIWALIIFLTLRAPLWKGWKL